jgi:eukaryotic-like serine/threonine-protein kinase
MADRVGQHLGNYLLLQLLGEGGFAEVYLGEHVHLGTQAAIKVLSAKLQREEVEHFREEARTIARLRHPSIVRVLDFGVENGVPFLVMDYAANGTLRQRHSKGTRLTPAVALPYVRQVASALQFAHEHRLIHRDVKPENMLVGESGEVLLSDFGIAIVAQSSRYQSAQDVVGTLAYMAPEQIQAHPRPASDQYALGVVVYEWLTGERPFAGSMSEVLAKQISMPPPPLREKLPALSPEIEQVVLTALEKDPKARFASVQAFAAAFEQACQREGMFFAPTQRMSYPIPAPLPTLPLPPASAPAERTSLPPTSAPTERASQSPARVLRTASERTANERTMKPAGGVSRRAVLIGGGALVGLVAVGGGIWFTRAQGRQGSNGSTGAALFTYRGHADMVYEVAWSPDGKRIASASRDGTAQAWDASDGSNVIVYPNSSGLVSAVAWSPDGSRIASGGSDRTVRVWDVNNGSRSQGYAGHNALVSAVAWSPNSTDIASASYDTTVLVLNVNTPWDEYTYRGHSTYVNAVSWSPDGGRIASGSSDQTVQVWDAKDGANANTYRYHSGLVNAVSWSPDGSRIASGSDDQTVVIWGTPTAGGVTTVLFTYTGHSTGVSAVAWSPDSKRVASASYDTTVQVWGAEDGGNVYVYRGHTDRVFGVAWSPDGKYIASCGADKTVQVWKAPG